MSDTEVRIRRAVRADLPTIVAFNCAMAIETEDKTLDPGAAERGVRRALDDPQCAIYFLAEVDGKVVGQTMITVEWSDWRDAYFWWIQSVYVAPPYRRRGVFRRLHEHIRQEARSHADVCGLRLYVHRRNDRAVATYRELGMPMTQYVLCEEEWDPRGGCRRP